MHPVQDYILGFDGEQQALLQYFYDVMELFPEIEAKIKWRIPVFFRKKQLCYVNPLKNGGIELCFMKGHFLSNEHGLLQIKGRKLVAGITFRKVSDIPEDIVFGLIQEAILLDDEKWKIENGKWVMVKKDKKN